MEIETVNLINICLSEENISAFFDMQEPLQEIGSTEHSNPTKIMCVHSNASDLFWEDVMTWFHEMDLENAHVTQSNDPLASLYGFLSKKQEHWVKFQK